MLMNRKADAIIVGAGIIGCAIAFEMSKKGYRTLNIDKLASAGAGSTSNSCANVRAYYSTRDGVAMAYESFSYWKNWRSYLEAEDERGYAKFKNIGSVLLKSKGLDWKNVLENFKKIGVEHEDWDLETLKKKMPMCDFHSFWPPKRPEDDHFWDDGGEELEGAIYTPGSGYISDPQLSTHNLQRASEARGGEFLFNSQVVEIRRADGHVLGVTLKNGDQIDGPVVLNASGPHSFIINRMAGVEEGMNIKTRALRHEVHHVPAPEGCDFENEGYHTNDGDTGSYFRPEVGNNILVGSVDPACDPKEWVDPDDFNREVTEGQWKAQVYRLAKRVPDLQIPTQPQGVCDLYDVSDDWIPIYDKSDLNGFYMAVGTSGNQYKTAPVVGAMMTELIDACEKGRDQDKDPLQFRMHHTGLTINTGFYSRLRKINPNSSFSVIG
jgi:sarcosine oxidase subunit beta